LNKFHIESVTFKVGVSRRAEFVPMVADRLARTKIMTKTNIVLDRPIVFDLRSIGPEYWKNHICVINEALKCFHFYVKNYFRHSRLFLILTKNRSCVLPRVSDGPYDGEAFSGAKKMMSSFMFLEKEWVMTLLDKFKVISYALKSCLANDP
jgi:hypothetical protein